MLNDETIFCNIPGYSGHQINQKGEVLNVAKGTLLQGSRNPAGYVNYRITDDKGVTLTWGRHRLLGYVFKHPGVDITDLVVNHLNGIKGDDWLDNLEWTTPKGNIEHAGINNLTLKCLPVDVRNASTGEIKSFPSATECGSNYGLSKDAMLYRLRCGEARVFPEGNQYRLSKTTTPWIVPDSVTHSLLENGTSKSVLMRCVLTDRTTSFLRLSDLANHLKVVPAVITSYLSKPNQPVLPGFIQVKLGCDPTPWRSIEDPYAEINKLPGVCVVRVVSKATGAVALFTSAKECASTMNLNPTALNYRLKSQGKKVFSDGYSYAYY